MPTLLKIKNPIELSFLLWMSHFPDSAHPTDSENFLKFCKNVAVFGNKRSRWRDPEFLERKILKLMPHFNPDYLHTKLVIFESVLEYHKIKPTPRTWFVDHYLDSKKDYYLEQGVKNGQIYTKELPMP